MNLGFVCDHCLGRQFAKLLSGYSNDQRGEIVRRLLAMEYEAKPFKLDTSNFHGFTFRRKMKTRKPGICVVCKNLFEELPKFADQAAKILKKMDSKSFMVGVKMNDALAMAEESLWEKSGIAYCEPIKSELNRELGKLVEKKTGKIPDENRPEIIVLLDLQNKQIETLINPVYVYGEYRKLVRGIPQTKMKGHETVEDIIAKPLMKTTRASSHTMHACGREDRQAKCLAWRPFVLEINQPLKRRINLKIIEREINRGKMVKVRNLRYSSRKEIVEIKRKKVEKVYRLRVNFENPVRDIQRVGKIVGVVKQKTPRRLLKSKPDKLRHKKVKSIKWKKINTKIYEFEVRTESGLYINELVSGDKRRTKPSISEILENPGELKQFDVVKIFV
ncbi:MAG: tRNA pseudouridine(54/55) synthase Pus10 [Candidatus Aenigmarchaeota archaeon]|nr:tRNA pseudouridine(54/55) synthase Pus10 [Candidatus Aenigmarchaeota archaeon]